MDWQNTAKTLCEIICVAAVCCSVVQCGAVWCSVMQCGAVCCSVLAQDTAKTVCEFSVAKVLVLM